MTTIIIIILAIICIILGYQLSKKVKVDNAIYQRNEELKRANELEQQSYQRLKSGIASLSYEYQYLNKQKEDSINELNNIRNNISSTISQNKEISDNAFRDYEKTLEQAYVATELSFDKRVELLSSEMQSIQQDLDKLKATRAAAYEALMKEQEIKDNKDNYRLIVPEIEKRDIKLLNSIKKELINERPVNMIIWQTYYSKRANDLCTKILGTKNVIGIYKITEISTGRCYIGQSKNIKDRLREHMKCGLGIDTPNGNKLYQAMLDSSIEDFTFELIEECCAKDLDEKERYFISLYQSYDYGFNSNRGNNNGRA